MKIENILWDLDGTLTDPKEGIIQCIQYALDKADYIPPAMDQLLWCIGPPLHDSFLKLVPGSTKEEANTLVNFYRERFANIGIFENVVYPYISHLLASQKISKQNILATSKPHIYANKILSHFDLIQYFSAIHGSELSGERSDKGELIKYILQNENLNHDTSIMIGDRMHDILGAKKAGIASIGITWGYGSMEELKEAGADFIFTTPKLLGDFLKKTNKWSWNLLNLLVLGPF
jgi:phosphoglycolate phosphatase